MLVLTRKLGEKIRIGHDIVVQVMEIKRKGIRLGIDAPTQVSILRDEIAEQSAGIHSVLPASKRR